MSLRLSQAPTVFQFSHNQRRVDFYQTMVALEDAETQKRGIVLVLFQYHVDRHNLIRRERITKSIKFLQGLPFKFVGVHYCCSEESMPFFLPFQNMIQYLIGSDGRRHFRTHRGKHAVYALQLWAITFLWNDSTTNPLLLCTYTIRCIQRLDYGN